MQIELKLYLRKLKSMQAEYAHGKLATPNDKTAFGYGQASGEYIGLLRAEKLLEQAIEEVADDESK